MLSERGISSRCYLRLQLTSSEFVHLSETLSLPTLLNAASESGHVEVVKILLDNRADVTVPNDNGSGRVVLLILMAIPILLRVSSHR